MPITDQTRALRAEARQASVMDRRSYAEGARSFRPMIARLSAQMSRFQELLIEVEETEDNEEVRGQLVSFQAALRAIDRRTTVCEKELSQLSSALRTLFEDMLPPLLAAIDRNDEGVN